MNTPNKLTILRVILIPVFMIFMLMDNTVCRFVALGIFIIASLTDSLDGYLARKNNQITNFGKFMDPLADKLLTTSAYLALMSYDLISAWAILIILAREFMVSGIRLSAVGDGKVIAASNWGKAKTVSQMLALIVSIFIMNLTTIPYNIVYIIINVLVWISTILTLISGFDYLIKNKDCLKMK